MDVLVGIHDRTVTAGACCILCTLGVIQDFKQAAGDLQTVAGIRVSPERLHQIVEAEGRRIMEARRMGARKRGPPAWVMASLIVAP